MNERGRLLGIDYGEKRVGLAVCDPDRIIASPLSTFERDNPVMDAEYFRNVARAEQIVGGLQQSYGNTVVITLGAKGAAFHDGKEHGHVPALRAKATTG